MARVALLVVRVGLVLAWLTVLLGVLLLAERPSTYRELAERLADGSVDSVEVYGEPRYPMRGVSRVELSWRDGLAAHRTTILVSRPLARGRAMVQDGRRPDATWVTSEDVATLLRSVAPDVQVSAPTTPSSDGSLGTLPGLRLPSWVATTSLLALLATVFFLVLAGPTRVATPWAWFWLLTTPLFPLVGIAIATVGHARRLRPASARRPRHGLTGGWAFLLTLPLGVLVAALGGAFTGS